MRTVLSLLATRIMLRIIESKVVDQDRKHRSTPRGVVWTLESPNGRARTSRRLVFSASSPPTGSRIERCVGGRVSRETRMSLSQRTRTGARWLSWLLLTNQCHLVVSFSVTPLAALIVCSMDNLKWLSHGTAPSPEARFT